MNLKDKNVLVTGGAGFIGSHLVDRLITEEPANIIVIDNYFLGRNNNLSLAERKFGDRLKIYQQDATEERTREIFSITEPDVVFNLAVIPLLASHKAPRLVCDNNIEITLNMLEYLKDGLYETLIHCSSSEVYGSAISDTMDENHPLLPTTPYGASKAASDLLVQSYTTTFDLDTTIVRPFNNYGPRQNDGSYAGVIPITCKRIMNGLPPIIHGDGMQTRDYIYVGDTVDGFIKTYNTPNARKKVISLCTGKEITILKIIKTICKHMNYNGEVKVTEARTADVRRHCGNTESMKIIDFEPKITFSEGIRETIRRYGKA
jgi:UDP-glucose 4-epimerase